jgi:CheY-like chemotaxis protein
MLAESLIENKDAFKREYQNPDFRLQPFRPLPPARSKMLVVDDDIEMAEVIKHSLSRCYGIEVKVASDPYEAITLMLDGTYDFVLLDWNLPTMNGFGTICEAEKIFLQAARTLGRISSKKIRVATFSAGMSRLCRIPSTRHFTYVGHVSKQNKLQEIVQSVHQYFSGVQAMAH